jgi:polyhydroxyalkanoate synthesis regulator protein
VTLAQIIFEEEKKRNHMPLAVLREIIRHPGESLSGFIQKEVTPRVASIREEAESLRDRLLRREDRKEDFPLSEEHPSPAATAPSGSSDLLKSSHRLLEEWQRKIDERVKVVVEGVIGNLPALGRDLHELMQRLEALEKKISELEQKD